MKTSILTLILLLMFSMDVKAQVIYERTYPDDSPSIEIPFELSNLSTVSFANNGVCPFMEWRFILANGNLVTQKSLDVETGHSLQARSIGANSILVSYRMGPLDFEGYNCFKVKLWTPLQITTLVEDTVSYSFWEDRELNYGAYLFKNNKLIYQKQDTLYEKNIATGLIENEVIRPQLLISNIFPVRDYLAVFSPSDPTTLYDMNLQPVFTWSNSLLPGEHAVSIDSFLVGVSVPGYHSLHIINAFDQTFRDVDLSAYISQISYLSVNKNVLMVRGKLGAQPIVVQLNAQFNILAQYNLDIPNPVGINEMSLTYFPDRVYAWSYDGLSNYKANYRVCYQYPAANPIQYVDVSLDSIWVDSIYYWPPDQHLPASVFVKCKVNNHSADTIESLTIHFEELPLGTCDPGVYPRHYEGLNILPGETGIVSYQTYSWELPFGDPFIRTFFVEHGNHHLDSISSNNIYTVSYIASDIKEPLQDTIVVVPNPFLDHLSTTLRSNRIDLVLYDQIGNKIAHGQDQLNDLSDLPVGIYFLQIHAGKQVMVRKVVKVE